MGLGLTKLHLESSHRTIAVTGSASGMGAATTHLLRRQGHAVIGVDLRDADVEADLSTTEGRDLAVRAITDRAAVALHGIVTFAGVSGFADRRGSLVVSTNYFGAVDLLVGTRPLLAATSGAAAIAISSNAATTAPGIDTALVEACLAGDEASACRRADEVGGPGSYAAAKLALARWVRRVSTTDEWIGAQVTLNAIAPGRVETPLVAEMAADPTGHAVLERIPVPAGRGGTPEEIAGLVAFLLGPEARFIVGSVIYADGGTDARIRPDAWPSPRP